MSQASLREGAAGELQLAGVLDYSSGPALREQGGRLIRASQAAELVVDCSAVERSSSVGISLLLAFMRDARKAGKVLSVRALPDDMREIAKVSSLLESCLCRNDRPAERAALRLRVPSWGSQAEGFV